jgi:mono/diheme cytochrome c family protein
MFMTTRAVTPLCLTLLTAGAMPTLAADVPNGELLARRWCSSCHVVAIDQSSPSAEAPPFLAIARTPGLDAGKIALFLLYPHPKMPDMGLSRQEATDLAAYISSLR